MALSARAVSKIMSDAASDPPEQPQFPRHQFEGADGLLSLCREDGLLDGDSFSFPANEERSDTQVFETQLLDSPEHSSPVPKEVEGLGAHVPKAVEGTHAKTPTTCIDIATDTEDEGEGISVANLRLRENSAAMFKVCEPCGGLPLDIGLLWVACTITYLIACTEASMKHYRLYYSQYCSFGDYFNLYTNLCKRL